MSCSRSHSSSVINSTQVPPLLPNSELSHTASAVFWEFDFSFKEVLNPLTVWPVLHLLHPPLHLVCSESRCPMVCHPPATPWSSAGQARHRHLLTGTGVRKHTITGTRRDATSSVATQTWQCIAKNTNAAAGRLSDTKAAHAHGWLLLAGKRLSGSPPWVQKKGRQEGHQEANEPRRYLQVKTSFYSSKKHSDQRCHKSSCQVKDSTITRNLEEKAS